MEPGSVCAADPQEGAEIRSKMAFRSFCLSVSLASLLFSASVLVFSFFHVDPPCSFIRVAQYGLLYTSHFYLQFKLPSQTYTKFHFCGRENLVDQAWVSWFQHL